MSKDLAKSNEAPQVPAFMVKASSERQGVDEAAKYQSKPRVSIIQNQARKERRDEYGVGSIVVMPEGTVLAEGPDAEFVGIPILFTATFETHSDFNDTDSPLVMDSSNDPSSEIARKSRIKGLRSETYGDDNQYRMSHIEVLNAIVMVDSGAAAGTIGVISFSKSDHSVGRKLASFLRRSPTDIYGNRVSFQVTSRSSGQNDWYGWKLNNPEDGNVFVQDETQFAELAALHTEWAALVGADTLRTYNDEDVTTSGKSDLPAV